MEKKKRLARPRRPDALFSCHYCKKTVLCYHPRWLKPSWHEGAVDGNRAFWCSRACGVLDGIIPN